MIDLNIKCQTTSRENLSDIEVGKYFLDLIAKTDPFKKLINWTFSKLIIPNKLRELKCKS